MKLRTRTSIGHQDTACYAVRLSRTQAIRISLLAKSYLPEFGLSGQPQLSVYDLDCLQIGFLNYWRYAGLFFEEGVGGQGTHQVE